ncbi:hypothetical protein GTW43_01595 [Streptomyces sp. SID5785]|uniref:hypothetical protein n=1 Tax=Streptomyces sp. SID5785 TaxID=2690309 RepID=UPI0013610E8D|nr:hypothetical protein [Streptomyces sp. SID5785]MZD03777.1 hypothetical protein [Streptomyces sp. SID5785]
MLIAVLGLVIVLGVVGVLASVLGGGDDTPPGKAPSHERTAPSVPGPRGDAKITKCSVSEGLSYPTAEVQITNRSSKTSDYLVSVEFVDAKGERITDTFVATNRLAPHQVAHETAQGFREAHGSVVCRITDVSRTASL